MTDPETSDECLDVMAVEYEWMAEQVRDELHQLRDEVAGLKLLVALLRIPEDAK